MEWLAQKEALCKTGQTLLACAGIPVSGTPGPECYGLRLSHQTVLPRGHLKAPSLSKN